MLFRSEMQGLGIDFAANGVATLQRLVIRDQRTFAWSIENPGTILLTPTVKELGPIRISFEVKEDLLVLSWSQKAASETPPVAVLIELGRKDVQSTDWSGKVSVKGATVANPVSPAKRSRAGLTIGHSDPGW